MAVGMRFKVLSLAWAAALGGCATLTLPVQATMQGTPERLTGTATGHLDGAGELRLTSTTTGAVCQGKFVYTQPREGSGTLSCSDGRSGPFKFASTGSRGTGDGALDGTPFTFTFGL